PRARPPSPPPLPTRRSSDLIDRAGQPHQRMAQIDDRFQRRPQQVFLTIVPWLCHRVPPTQMTRHRIAQIVEKVNPKSPEIRPQEDRKSTRLNSSHQIISYAV